MSRRFNFLPLSVLLLLYIFLLQGCATEERFTETTTVDQFQKFHKEDTQAKQTRKTVSPMLPVEGITAGGGGDYLLGAGDLISITVFEAEELSRDVRVSARGNINVALIGDVNVLNLSTGEAEQKIEDFYKKDYLHDPHVSVYIKEHMSKQITLVGALENPGTFTYVTSRRLLDVLAMAGGLDEEAGSIAYVTRADHRTGETKNYFIDLDDLIKNGNMAHNHVVLGGDVIFIPNSGQFFVDGAVRKPGTYPLTSNITITEGITMAGGLAGWADDDKIKLIRYMGRGKERQVVSLSYSQLQAGVGDTLVLLDQDIIYAESSGSGKLFSGAGFSIGFMGTGVTYKDPEQ